MIGGCDGGYASYKSRRRVQANQMIIEKGKIDFLQMPRENKDRIQQIASNPGDHKKHVGEAERALFHAYMSFLFLQITVKEYDQAWAEFVSFLGLTPKDKGIRWLKSEVDKSMKNIIYENLWTARKLDPQSYIEMMFYQELYKILLRILKEKHLIRSDVVPEKHLWSDDTVLYVYKGRTSCHSGNHPIESATAIFTGRSDSKIKINVEHCMKCRRFFIQYSVYERYREKYSMLLGKIKMDASSSIGVHDIVLSEFSPLKLCGYSVSQQDGYSRTERQYIISKVIEKGILSKNEVIQYLEHFISRNGQKSSNSIALSKWKEDLDFALHYRMSEQTNYKLKYIKKY